MARENADGNAAVSKSNDLMTEYPIRINVCIVTRRAGRAGCQHIQDFHAEYETVNFQSAIVFFPFDTRNVYLCAFMVYKRRNSSERHVEVLRANFLTNGLCYNWPLGV